MFHPHQVYIFTCFAYFSRYFCPHLYFILFPSSSGFLKNYTTIYFDRLKSPTESVQLPPVFSRVFTLFWDFARSKLPIFWGQNPPRFFRACPQWELSRRSSVALAEPGDKNHAVDDGKWPFFTGKSGEIDHGIMLNNEKIINDSQIRAIFFRW